MAIETLYPAIRPSLNLDFANSKVLDPRITFSRASAATYYDGKTVAKSEENLLTYSQEFGNAVWTKNAASVVDNVVVAPDGSVTADKLVESDTNSAHNIQRAGALTVGQQYVFSIYVKAAGRSYAFFADSAANGISVNLTNGTIATVVGSVSNASAVEAPAGSGWWRVSFAFIAFGTFLNLYAAQDAVWANRFYQGDGTSGIYLWGAQLEQRSQVTAYTPTTSQPITNYIPVLQTAPAGVPRFDHNPVTGESLGLLVEEQRTNVLTYSEQFSNAAWTKNSCSIAANTLIAPDGTLSADKVIEDLSSSVSHDVRVVGTQVTEYTVSVYAKAGERKWLKLTNATGGVCFDLGNGVVGSYAGTGAGSAAIFNVGNGWYRCSVKLPSVASGAMCLIGPIQSDATLNYAGDGYSGIYIWGAQLEAGAFPTSYIKTEASQVTRTADSASMMGANFSSWFNQSEGTMFSSAVCKGIGANGASVAFSATDGTISNRFRCGYHGGPVGSLPTATSCDIATTAASQFSAAATYTQGFVSSTLAYARNNSGASFNASPVVPDADCVIPSVNRMQIGNADTGRELNGHIKRISYYPKRLSDAQLVALTT